MSWAGDLPEQSQAWWSMGHRGLNLAAATVAPRAWKRSEDRLQNVLGKAFKISKNVTRGLNR